VSEQLRSSLSEIKRGVSIDSSISPLFSSLESALYQVEDVAHQLQENLQRICFDEGRLESIEMRLDEIGKLKKKYGGSVEEVLCYLAKAKEEVALIESNERELERLIQERHKVEQGLAEKAWALSKKRVQAASLLGEKVEKELGGLGMKKACFKVDLKKEKGEQGLGTAKGVILHECRLTEKGFDLVEFLISPNLGEEMKPLAKIASGGELSRIVLALKKIVTKEKKTSTLIFDEVDSGIGGATAEEVGKKLKSLSRQQQTICITHLPQIASFADQHQSISKKVERGRTGVFVKSLDSPKEREAEVARMLGGAVVTAKTREHAREMIKGARGKG
jgi:DNA repair protein RecN (Recombination protein N)